MDKKDKHTVSDHAWGESYMKEKMKRSLLGSCKSEVESTTADEATAAKSPSPTLHECNICGKVFSSGKALGGHRRSHFQKHQKKVKVLFTYHSSKAGDYDADDAGKPVCCICKKEFPTKNALFGHMRSHPERSWKGVSPPTHSPNKNSSSSSLSSAFSFSSQNSDSVEKNMEEDHYDNYDDWVGGGGGNGVIIDLSTFTSPSWRKTDVRGRECIGVYEAAEILTYLSADSQYFCSESNRISPKKVEVLPNSAPPLIKLGKRKVGEWSSSKKHEVKKIKFHLKGELKIGKKNDGDDEFDDDEGEKLNRCKGLSKSGVGRILYIDEEVEEEDGVDEDFDDVIAVLAPARVQDHIDERKMKRVVDHKGKNSKKLVLKSKAKDTEYENGGQEKENVGGYKCDFCGKKFSTFQGLGGHRSVHKEKNTVIMDESNRSEAAVSDQEDNSSSSSNMHKVNEATMTEAPLPIDETTANGEAPLLADEACQSSPGTKKLDFDLNELPCATED